MKAIFSVDVEDWFHILDAKSTPSIEEWHQYESRVERNFYSLLQLFSEKQVFVTCFFLGWVAEKFPNLVKEASSLGHEIASHGYSHILSYRLSENDFFEDVMKAKSILEDLSGRPVLGYRSPGFSGIKEIPWFFDKLIDAGYVYDSSIFPAKHGHGGISSSCLAPHLIMRADNSIIEFPITVLDIMGYKLCLFGGGYLRLFPYRMIKWGAKYVIKDNRPVIFYIHPREIDPSHPRLPLNSYRTFKSYVNLKTTKNKLDKILDEFQFTTFQRYIKKEQEVNDSNIQK